MCFGELLELGVIKRCVAAIPGHELPMGALLHDIAAVYHQNRIGVLNGGQPVGDDEAGLAPHQLLHGRLDALLRLGVHVGGGFVQDQHFGVQQHGPGDGQQLLLALGDVQAVLVDDGVIPIGQAADVAVDMGGFGGGGDFFQGGAGLAVGDIVQDGPAEQASWSTMA